MTTTMKMKKYGIGNALATGSSDKVTGGVSQAALGVIVAMAGLVGVWGLVCLASGIARSGGLLELVRNWLTAVGV